jgi:hypothetical protein
MGATKNKKKIYLAINSSAKVTGKLRRKYSILVFSEPKVLLINLMYGPESLEEVNFILINFFLRMFFDKRKIVITSFVE